VKSKLPKKNIVWEKLSAKNGFVVKTVGTVRVYTCSVFFEDFLFVAKWQSSIGRCRKSDACP
jgi:hypothetical protein